MSDRWLTVVITTCIFALLAVFYSLIGSGVRYRREQRAAYEMVKAAPSVGGIDIIDLPDGRRAYTMRTSHGVAIFVMEQPSAEPE